MGSIGVWVFVLFFNSAGDPLRLNGYHPRLAPDIETCEVWKSKAHSHFEIVAAEEELTFKSGCFEGTKAELDIYLSALKK